MRQGHCWFSGRILISHVGDPGSVPSTCIMFTFVLYVKEMTSASLMHETGHSKLMLWDNPEGYGGEGGGRGVQDEDGEHMYTCCQFMLMDGKTITILSGSYPPIRIN